MNEEDQKASHILLEVNLTVSINHDFLEPEDLPEMSEFSTDLPKHLGHQSATVENSEEPTQSEKLEEEIDQAMAEVYATKSDELLTKYAQEATKYYRGTALIPLSCFSNPKQWVAARDFNKAHAMKLAQTWKQSGVLFPDKLAVVCIFGVTSLRQSTVLLRYPKRSLPKLKNI